MTAMQSSKTVKALVGISFVIMIVVNALANILPINGIGTGEVSDSYPNLFAPAGVTFAIWGIIYLLLAGYVAFQFGAFRSEPLKLSNQEQNQIGLLFILSSFANGAWIFSWHYGMLALSLILMLTILSCLISITSILHKHPLSKRERYLIKLPFSIYFGWITVALIANVTAFLVDIGWNRFGISETIWTMVILVVGAFIGTFTIRRNRDAAYGLVFLWAYIGIWLKHTSIDGFQSQYPMVIVTVIVCFVILTLAEFSLLFLKKNKQGNGV